MSKFATYARTSIFRCTKKTKFSSIVFVQLASTGRKLKWREADLPSIFIMRKFHFTIPSFQCIQPAISAKYVFNVTRNVLSENKSKLSFKNHPFDQKPHLFAVKAIFFPSKLRSHKNDVYERNCSYLFFLDCFPNEPLIGSWSCNSKSANHVSEDFKLHSSPGNLIRWYYLLYEF